VTINRRTFLGTGASASAALVVGPNLPIGYHRSIPSAPVAVQSAVPGTLTPIDLRVTGLADPVGVDPDDCAFAWKLRAPGRTAMQQAYRILVRRQDPGHRALVWDSGTVRSARQAFVAYDGPTLAADAAYSWTVQVRDGTGQWSAPSPTASFATALRQDGWSAQWLQPSASSSQPDRVTYVRTDIDVPVGRISRATAFLAAAHTGRLHLNGAQLDLGPAFCYPDEQYFRCIDVTTSVRAGRTNAIGVLHRWYGPGQGRPESFPGLLLQLSVHYDDGRHAVFGTNGDWRERVAEWLPSPQRNGDGEDFVEWVDGQAHPLGWDEPGFDDAGWVHPAVIGPAPSGPFTHTYVQRTAIADHPVQPVSVRTLPTGAVVADFGAIYAAHLRVDFGHGQSGHTVRMRVGYLLDPDGQVSVLHGTQGSNLSFSYITRAGQQTFEALTYLGFRYLQIDDPGETMRAGQITAIATHAAMPGVPMAVFSTDNRMLNAVWKLNARSCLYCTHEQFVDTPTREKGQFVWDAANESEAVMLAYGEQNLTWQGLRDVARGQARYHADGRVNAVYPNGDGSRDFPTFTARYPEWVWRYYVATGDLDTAVILYPTLVRVADYLWAPGTASPAC
jgi:alpha-L-rhamnosidase